MASATPNATRPDNNSVNASASALPNSAMTCPRTVIVARLKSAKHALPRHAHAQASGQSGDHVMASVALDIASASSPIHVPSTPMATRHHHRLRLSRAASPKYVSRASGASGRHAMPSVIHLGELYKKTFYMLIELIQTNQT